MYAHSEKIRLESRIYFGSRLAKGRKYDSKTRLTGLGLGLWCLTPLSTIYA